MERHLVRLVELAPDQQPFRPAGRGAAAVGDRGAPVAGDTGPVELKRQSAQVRLGGCGRQVRGQRADLGDLAVEGRLGELILPDHPAAGRVPVHEPDRLLALDEALQALEARDPRKAQLVKLRYFAGLTVEQAAEALGISASTADNDWAYARGWLRLAMTGDQPDRPGR